MNDIKTKQRFFELRAQGKSLMTAANELGIGLQTAVRWGHKHKEQIENMKAVEQSSRIGGLTSQRAKISHHRSPTTEFRLFNSVL